MGIEVDEADARSFYRSALAAGQFLDGESGDRLFDVDADAAWRTYGADLPVVVRFDLALRNLAMLYPAAFAPGPVFQLPGWYDDDPWGVGFARPPRDELEAMFRDRAAASSLEDILKQSAAHWGATSAAALKAPLSPTTQVLVAGSAALLSVATALARESACDVRSQVILLADDAGPRHLLGIASALRRSSGMPRFLSSSLTGADNGPGATVLVSSSDASAAERAAATQLADRWNIRAADRFDL